MISILRPRLSRLSPSADVGFVTTTAEAGAAVGWLVPPADPLLLLAISPFQFVHAGLLIA